jgi:hypothetical protein
MRDCARIRSRVRRTASLLRRSCLLTGAVCALVFHHVASAQVDATAVRAAHLFNMGKFIKWPDSVLGASTPTFNICLPKSSPLASLFQAAKGKTVQEKPISVLTYDSDSIASFHRLHSCHILYAEPCEGFCKKALEELQDSPVLTVTEEPEISVVHFVEESQRLKFGIDADLAKRSGLQFSAQILKLSVSK